MKKLLILCLILAAPVFADRASDTGIDPTTPVGNLTEIQLLQWSLSRASADSIGVWFRAAEGGKGDADSTATAYVWKWINSEVDRWSERYKAKYGQDAIVAARLQDRELELASERLARAAEKARADSLDAVLRSLAP